MKNKISKTLFLVIPLLLLGSAVVSANDTYLGSVGGNAFNNNEIYGFYPQTKSTSIQMVKERVYIKVYPDSFVTLNSY